MDSSSTNFPTWCEILHKNSAQALTALSSFLKEVYFDGEFLFEKSNPVGFRFKAKLACRGSWKNPQIGLFAPGTHDLIDQEDCPIHHPLITKAIHVLKECLKTFQIAPYDEKKHTGTLRYVQLVLNARGELQMVLVINQKSAQLEDASSFLTKRLPVVSLWLNFQPEVTNTIFGKKWELVAGHKYLSQHVRGKKLYFHPAAFCQSNLLFFENIIKDILFHVPSCQKALDLYAGVGLLGITLEELFQEVSFAESNPFSKESFEETISHFPHHRGKYFLGDAKEYLAKNLDADCVIIDPPRKGLSYEIKPLLGEMKNGSYLIYISCGYTSLIRDLKELIALGYLIKFIKGYDCFPGSGEIETVCILQKTAQKAGITAPR